MGKLYTKNIDLGASINVTKSAPLDVRLVVQSFDDLIKPVTWKSDTDNIYFHYTGMPVVVVDTGTIYIYKGKSASKEDVQNQSNWEPLTTSTTTTNQILNQISQFGNIFTVKGEVDTYEDLIDKEVESGDIYIVKINGQAYLAYQKTEDEIAWLQLSNAFSLVWN